MRQSLDTYDVLPAGMVAYMKHYGKHFSKKACEHAVSLMRKRNRDTGKAEPFMPLTKERVDAILKNAGLTLENNVVYDYVFVANMAVADFYGSSITDELHLARYIKDVIDDVDQSDGYIFNRWYADMCNAGTPVEWCDLL